MLVIVVIIGVGGAMGSGSSSKKSGSKVTYANYKKINLSKDNGTTKEEANKLFGKKPSTTSTDELEGVKTDTETWDGAIVGSSLTIGFEDGHAVNKVIDGLKVNRKHKITLADYDTIQNGQTKKEILDKFGKPNGYSHTNILGKNSETWSYTSGIKGDSGANFVLTFDDGVVTVKTQTSMK
nr:DUF3862 domain-containing protein [Limosilactobacillus alvi]